MKGRFFASVIINAVLVTALANCYGLISAEPLLLLIAIPLFILISLLSGAVIPSVKSKGLLICRHGAVLLYSFCVSLNFSLLYQIPLLIKSAPAYSEALWSILFCFAVNLIIFWNGIICVYITSTQLGIKHRVIGALCGMIPIINLIALFSIIRTVTGECLLEEEKLRLNQSRKDERICATKYPILLVHGVFFRDTKFFNYWGRIPKELEANGAQIFYGNHPSAASVKDSAIALTARINEILNETGAEKINIIAHSKGGLDCRYAIAHSDLSDRVASLTTVNTPHRGCLFADALLAKASDAFKNKVADAYNSTLRRLGEESPDFLSAVNDLTRARAMELNLEMPLPQGVFCQSIGSVMRRSRQGQFPLNVSYHLVKYHSGRNDGLVDENSFEWGEKFIFLTPTRNRGISHGDMIDLNRENIRGFDVREFYVQLVYDLKKRGF